MFCTLCLQCSFYPSCRSSRQDNDRAVAAYESVYGAVGGPAFPCLYNPARRSEVIQRRRFQTQHVVNGLAWSCVLLVLSLAFLVYALRRRGCLRS